MIPYLYDSESITILYQNLKIKMNISMILILKITNLLLHRILFIAKIKKFQWNSMNHNSIVLLKKIYYISIMNSFYLKFVYILRLISIKVAISMT